MPGSKNFFRVCELAVLRGDGAVGHSRADEEAHEGSGCEQCAAPRSSLYLHLPRSRRSRTKHHVELVERLIRGEVCRSQDMLPVIISAVVLIVC